MSRSRSTLTLLAVALATFMTYLDNNIVNVAMPAIQQDLHLTHLRPGMGGQRVHPGLRLPAAGRRPVGRCVRPQAVVPGRPRRSSPSPRWPPGWPATPPNAGRQPGGAGLGRGAGHPDHAGDHLRDLHRCPQTGCGSGHLEWRRRAGTGRRSVAGRAAEPARQLGMDLLHQRARSAWPPSRSARGSSPNRKIDAGPRRLDVPGLLTSAVALFALTYALIEGQSRGWTSPLSCPASRSRCRARPGVRRRRAAQPAADGGARAVRASGSSPAAWSR